MKRSHPTMPRLLAFVLIACLGGGGIVPAQAKPGDGQKPDPKAEAKAAVTRHLAMLTAGLQAKDERQCVEALIYLARYPKDPRVVGATVKALGRPGKTGETAAGVLGTVGGKKAASALVAALKKKKTRKDTDRAVAIIGAMGAIGTREVVKPILREIDAREERIAYAAISSATRVKVGRRQVISRMISRLESFVSRRKTESDAQKIQALAGRISALGGAISQMTEQDFVPNPTLIRRWWKKNKKRVPDKWPPPKKKKAGKK